jgi:ribosomal protein L37E
MNSNKLFTKFERKAWEEKKQAFECRACGARYGRQQGRCICCFRGNTKKIRINNGIALNN